MPKWIIAAAFALVSASPGLPTSGTINVANYGVVGDGKTDVSPALQRLVDGLTGPASLAFPPGYYRFRWPVYVDKPYVQIRGAGREVTVFEPLDRAIPPLVFGIRQAERAGKVRVGPEYRPTAFGVLDASIAPDRNAWRGFATRGRAYAGAVANPAQLGTFRDQGYGFDAYSRLDGLTVEAAVYAPQGLSALSPRLILGLGADDTPGPWVIGVDGNGELMVRFKTSDQSTDSHTEARDLRTPVPNVRGLVRLRVVWDHETGRMTVFLNGRELRHLDYPPHSRFARQRGHLPFWIGPSPGRDVFEQGDAKLPDFTIYAFRVSRGARLTEPRDDAGRYRSGPGTIIALDGAAPPMGRTLPLLSDRAITSKTGGVAFIGLTTGFDGGIIGNAVRDLTVLGGAPGIATAAVLHFTARDVETRFGTVGFGSIPCGANYTVNLTDVTASGSDAALSYTWSILWLTNVYANEGGQTLARFDACSGTWRGGLFAFTSNELNRGIDLIGGDYGGQWTLSDLCFDNEGTSFNDAVIVADTCPDTSLIVSNVAVSILGPKATMLRLRGKASTPEKGGGYVDASGLVFAPNGTPVKVEGDWWGRVRCVNPVGPALGDTDRIVVESPRRLPPGVTPPR